MQITQKGLNKLKKRLKYLKNEKRREISQKIRQAKELGDLSENASYQEAKEEKNLNESEIAHLRKRIRQAQIVGDGPGYPGEIQLGSQVVVKSSSGSEQKFTLVNIEEANPLEGLISNESPLGQALLKKKTGDEVTVKTPKGPINYKILKVVNEPTGIRQ